jgi:hypothetical protein
MPYVAHYVNIFGASQAAYELKAKDDETAKAEGREYLRRHPSIEVWDSPRWVARFNRDEGPHLRGH